jgi:SAM-dependent methyltransferase
MGKKYHHSEDMHNLQSPREIVPILMKLLQPQSVVDFGCGIGTFLHCFKEQGVKDVLGIDGPWVDKQLLSKYLASNEFMQADLENEINLPKKYDLAISVEVAEHLSDHAAETFVNNLVNAGNVIVFSAALPLQGGQNHINEQWIQYWEEKFSKHGYIVHDVLRPILWENQNVFWWYRQNMVVVAPKEFKFASSVTYNPIQKLVHYEIYQELASTIRGRASTSLYFKMLAKHFLGEKNFTKLKKIF